MNSNKDRAERFYRVSLVYAELVGSRKTDEDYESTLVRDILADIMHFCDEYAVDFERELGAGREHYHSEQPVEPPKIEQTIAAHNEPLRQAMFARGCEWQSNVRTEHFTKDGAYEPYPVGYIRGPHYDNNGNPRPYSYSVQGPDGWRQRSFLASEAFTDGPQWALETATAVIAKACKCNETDSFCPVHNGHGIEA